MAVANFLAPCSLLILTVLLKSNDLPGSVYQDNCFTWSNCRSVTQSILEWVAGVNVHSRKGTRVPSAILDSNCNSRFVTLYILLISGDINPNSGPQWKYPCGICHKPVKSNQQRIQCDYCDRWYLSKCCMNDLIYDALANSSYQWLCCDYSLPSFATSLFIYSGCMERSNRFSPLAQASPSHGSRVQASSPSHMIPNKGTRNITRKTSRIQDTLTPEPSSSNDSDNDQSSPSTSLPYACNSNQLRVYIVNFFSLVSYNKHLKLYQLMRPTNQKSSSALKHTLTRILTAERYFPLTMFIPLELLS